MMVLLMMAWKGMRSFRRGRDGDDDILVIESACSGVQAFATGRGCGEGPLSSELRDWLLGVRVPASHGQNDVM